VSETTMRRNLIRLLRHLDARSMESAISIGVPDINYCCGWIELKYVARLPVRQGTLVRIPHYTQEQRIWLLRRYRVSRNAFLLVQVDKHVFLGYGGERASVVGNLTSSELFERADLVMREGINVEKLTAFLHPWGYHD
jgi:hypothetical protein